MYMVWFVLDDAQKLDDILDAWHEVGVTGVTILESSSRHRRRQARPLGARYMFGAGRAVEHVEKGQFTLMTIVPDQAAVQLCQDAAEKIVGDLNNPDTGILVAAQLDHVKGVAAELQRRDQSDGEETRG